MSNGTSPGVTVKTEGVVVAPPKVRVGTFPGITIKAEGYVITPPKTELIQQGIIPPPTVLPSGVTIEAGGVVVTPSVAEMKVIEAEVIEQYPNLQPGEQVKVSVALPDGPIQKVTVTAPDKPLGAFYLDPEKLSEKNRTIAGIVVPEPVAWGLYQIGNFINFLAPPQPEARLFQDPAKFLYQATRTATLYTVPFAYLATNWSKLSGTEKSINAAIDVAFCLLLFGRPISRTIKKAITAGIGKTGAIQTIRLTNNLRTAIASRNTARIRTASVELENFGRAIESQGIRGGANIVDRAVHINRNADFYAKVKAPRMPVELQRTLNEIGDSLYPFRESRLRLYQPEPTKAKPGVKPEPVKTAVIPITREEAKRFGLSSRQVDDIFKRVGENRAAYLREAEAIRKAGMASIFKEVNEQIARAKAAGVPVPKKPSPTLPPPERKVPIPTTAQREAMAKNWAVVNERFTAGRIAPELHGLPEAEVARRLAYLSTAKANAVRQIIARAKATSYHATINKLRINPTLNPVKAKPVSKWQPTRPGEITKARMQRLLTEWQKMEADLAVRQMIQANLITAAIATNAAAVARLLASASTQTRARAMTQLSPAVRTALQTSLAQATTTAQSEAKAMSEALTKAQAMTQVATLTETLLRLQTKAQVRTEVGVSIATLARLATQTRAAIKTSVKVATGIKIKPVVKIVPPPVKPPPPKPPPPKDYVPLPLLLPSPGEAFRQLTPVQQAGSVCWRQGIMYILLYPPYGEKNIIHSRTPFPGVKIVKGARSAYESIARAKGREGALPPVITRDMGIQDIRITTPRRGKPKIHFKRDVKQRTRTTPRAGLSSMRG